MPPWGRRVILIGIARLLTIQVVAVDRTNPPVEQALPVAPSGPTVLRRVSLAGDGMALV